MILDWTRAERLSLADLFDGLTDDEWRAPSLCDGWTVLHNRRTCGQPRPPRAELSVRPSTLVTGGRPPGR